MSITNSSGTVQETASTDFDQFQRTGVHRADQFALCHRFDRFRQFQWDLTNATAGSVVTFAAGAGGSITLTLPIASGTLSTTAYTATTASDWAGAPPTTIGSAIDRIAAAVKAGSTSI